VIVVLAAGIGVLATAWLTSPDPTNLPASVRAVGSGRPTRLDAIAPIMRDAAVATEDERFYRHDGIDLIGVMRALPYDVAHLSLAQGASTITEQLAKNVYMGGSDHDLWRKLQDAAVAVKLEGRYPKEELLAAYLSTTYYGDGAYGIAEASRHYFGVPPSRLDASQASLLAGLIRAPSAYDPRTHPAAARSRQIEVLRSLVREGYLTHSEASVSLARPLPIRGGTSLQPVRDVDLAPGPAFVWWKLGLGVAIAVIGVAVFSAARALRFSRVGGSLALRLPALMLLVAGLATVIRSFRTA
jgi:membrane peptidoglycan carboxypeptidase